MTTRSCFNPRPALAGRASLNAVAGNHAFSLFQSSPGPRGPGVLAARFETMGIVMFQSSPGPRGPGVNVQWEAGYRSMEFQSSPGPRGPGVQTQLSNLPRRRCFNPRPALAGRASAGGRVYPQMAPVSILARPSRAGRRSSPIRHKRHRSVSILARPSRAGRRVGSVGDVGVGLVSILARPSRAGRPGGVEVWMAAIEFQSSPGPRGPGVGYSLRITLASICFNPRPALAGRASPLWHIID